MREEAPVSDARRDIGRVQARLPCLAGRGRQSGHSDVHPSASRSSKGRRNVSSRSTLARSSASSANRSQRTSITVSTDGPCWRPERCARSRSACCADLSVVESDQPGRPAGLGTAVDRGEQRRFFPGHVRLQGLVDPVQDAFDARRHQRSRERRQLAGHFVDTVDADDQLLMLVIHERPDHLPVARCQCGHAMPPACGHDHHPAEATRGPVPDSLSLACFSHPRGRCHGDSRPPAVQRVDARSRAGSRGMVPNGPAASGRMTRVVVGGQGRTYAQMNQAKHHRAGR